MRKFVFTVPFAYDGAEGCNAEIEARTPDEAERVAEDLADYLGGFAPHLMGSDGAEEGAIQ